jgi:hypothetical protein
MRMSISDITSVIRSKNSGPYELTLDMMFISHEVYQRVCNANAISEQVICRLYKLTPDKIINIIHFDPANAIKVTIARPICSGDLGETDVYGAQQHAPLLNLMIDFPD